VIYEEYKSPKSGDNSYRMILSTRQYLSKSPIKWTFRHVKGHDKKPRSEFDMRERLNDDFYKEAGEFRKWCEKQQRVNYCITLPNEPWAVWRGGEKISTHLHQDVYDGIHDVAADKVWTDAGWVNNEAHHSVDTTSLKQAAKSLPVQRRIWAMKHRFGMRGVNQFMKRWKYWTTSKCPQCGHRMETARRVNRCPTPGELTRWDKSPLELGTWMARRHAHPSLTYLLLSRLKEWRHRTMRSAVEGGSEFEELDQAQTNTG
jgi:hypothetical protein